MTKENQAEILGFVRYSELMILLNQYTERGMVMKEFEVNCINKSDRNSRHEHITHIGNSIGQWRLSRETAIKRIDAKSEAYYTVNKSTGKRAYIGVVREPGKAPYLRTHADGYWNDNLLAQAECGASCRLFT